jgi:AhpD family alkylhydroperoxidase
MSRLAPLPYVEWDTDALSVLAPGRKLPPSNVLGLFAQHPDLARAFLTFNKHLLFDSTLPARTRELVILRVAWRRRCRYEWAQHVLIAKRAGITDEEITETRAAASTPLARAVDELDADSRLSDATYAELAADLDDRQLMDLVFTVGAYGLLAMAFNTFEVELDPGLSADDF